MPCERLSAIQWPRVIAAIQHRFQSDRARVRQTQSAVALHHRAHGRSGLAGGQRPARGIQPRRMRSLYRSPRRFSLSAIRANRLLPLGNVIKRERLPLWARVGAVAATGCFGVGSIGVPSCPNRVTSAEADLAQRCSGLRSLAKEGYGPRASVGLCRVVHFNRIARARAYNGVNGKPYTTLHASLDGA
jgi:hypothetical protein